MRRSLLGIAVVALAACATDSEPGDQPDAANAIETADAAPGADVAPPDSSPAPEMVPVLFVHGVNGGSDNYAVMLPRLVEDGWPEDRLYALDFADPSWGCSVDNAATIAEQVELIRTTTGSDRVSIVAHSMGTLSSRYYVKNLGGHEVVNTYVTLGGMHHGLDSSCSPDFPFKPCIWDEICSEGEFVAQLNADPATPGELAWVSIYGTADETVPNSSSRLDGAENIEIEGVSHAGEGGLQEDERTYDEVKRVLRYPAWQ